MDHSSRLRKVGLRATKQRMLLASILFDHGDRHVTAEMLHQEALDKGFSISLSTIYNSLTHFVDHGLLRKVHLDDDRIWFDTSLDDHFHYFDTENQIVVNYECENSSQEIKKILKVPEGYKLKDFSMIVSLEAV